MFYFRFSFREIHSSYKLDPQTSPILHFRFTSGQWLWFLAMDSIICRRRRTRTTKVLTPLARPCPAGQTDNGQLFSKIRIESRQKNSDRQSSDSIFHKNPDRLLTADRIETINGQSGTIHHGQNRYTWKIETYRTRTDKHRTENTDEIRPAQTSDRIFRKFRTTTRRRQDTDSPPTSDNMENVSENVAIR